MHHEGDDEREDEQVKQSHRNHHILGREGTGKDRDDGLLPIKDPGIHLSCDFFGASGEEGLYVGVHLGEGGPHLSSA